jgi:hypothetical protein
MWLGLAIGKNNSTIKKRIFTKYHSAIKTDCTKQEDFLLLVVSQPSLPILEDTERSIAAETYIFRLLNHKEWKHYFMSV